MNQIRRDEGTARLDPSLAAWVDQQCDRFEEAWHTGPRPRIEDYLAGAPEDRALLHELIALEAHYRRLAGEDPQAQDYRQRFPAVETTWLEDAVAARVPALTAPSRVRTKSPWIAGPGERPTVAGYEVLGVLGRGGMGVVYQARDQRLQRLVALKMLLAGAQADSQDLSRFRAEAEAQARLQHPHIVQIHEVGEAAGRPYFALEFVDGGTLAQKLAGKPQPAEAAAQLVETLARAMHYAHQQGVVHRDLKPANVLLTTNDTPKITDFGLAKRLQGTVSQTQSGAVLGTPSYMAPEQASGQPKAIGPATDVYALGTILYEMLTGRPPFLGETTLATVLQVRSLEPVPPQRLQPKVPRDLQTICMKCLQKEPTKRYADAQELADDLRRFLAGESIRARPVGPGERLWRWCRRNPALAVASGLAALALLGVTVLSLAVALYKTQAQERTEAALKQSLRRTTENALEQGILLCKSGEVGSGMLWLVRGLQMPPDGSDDLQRALRANLAGWRRHLHPLRDCLEHPSEVRAIAVSPDGQTIAMASGNNVQLWKDGRPSGKLLRHKNQVRAVAFGPPDGRLILTGSWDGTAQLWDATTGEKKGDQFTHGKRIWSVAFSPDGQKVLTAGDGALVRLWNVARKGEPVSFTGHKLLVQTVAFSRDGKRILTGSRDNTAQLWDVDHPGKPVASLPHEHYVLAAAFSPNTV